MISEFEQLGISGYFVVRQKRIPITICQGFSVGIADYAYIPVLNHNGKYITEGFLTKETSTNCNTGTLTGGVLKYNPISQKGPEVSVDDKICYIYTEEETRSGM